MLEFLTPFPKTFRKRAPPPILLRGVALQPKAFPAFLVLHGAFSIVNQMASSYVILVLFLFRIKFFFSATLQPPRCLHLCRALAMSQPQQRRVEARQHPPTAPRQIRPSTPPLELLL